MEPNQTARVRRHLLGLVGLLFLLSWAWLMVHEPAGKNSVLLASSCLRIGLVLLALWLALPQLAAIKTKLPPWLLCGLAFLGLVIAVRPRAIVWLFPLAVAIAALQFMGWLFKPFPQHGKRNVEK